MACCRCEELKIRMNVLTVAGPKNMAVVERWPFEEFPLFYYVKGPVLFFPVNDYWALFIFYLQTAGYFH